MERSDVLAMKNITKVFPGVTALKDVNFSCREGEVHALMGENGAGKSTLIKLLSGASNPTSGEIFFKGEPLKAANPHEAQNQGIAIIYQELNLVPNMNAVENIFLGREMVSKGVISFPSMRKEAKKLLDNLGVSIDLKVPIKKLSVAQQQMIEIAKALSMNSSLIVMDEPTRPAIPTISPLQA
jgi:ribose transport system ATP-binding protein